MATKDIINNNKTINGTPVEKNRNFHLPWLTDAWRFGVTVSRYNRRPTFVDIKFTVEIVDTRHHESLILKRAIGRKSRFFTPVCGSRRNIAITFGIEKLE